MTFENLCAGVARGAPDLDARQIHTALRNLANSLATGTFPGRLGRSETAVLIYLVGYAAGIAGLPDRGVGTWH
jgi:hypothetical protein